MQQREGEGTTQERENAHHEGREGDGNFLPAPWRVHDLQHMRPIKTWAGPFPQQERAYERRNAQSKCFFYGFTRDADKHHEILRDRTIRREIKRMLNTDVPYQPPTGLLEPKPEPVEELHEDYCFMYKEEDAFVQGD